MAGNPHPAKTPTVMDNEKKVQDLYGVPFFGTAGENPLFTVDIVCPLFDYFLWWPAATMVPRPGGRTIILGLFLIVKPFLFLRCFSRFWRLLSRRPRGVIPPDMVPLASLAPAAVVPLTAALSGCLLTLSGRRGLRGPGWFCRCLRLLKFVCHSVQTD
jgi:hypothetical protein